jgi:hypothetical protein
MCRLAFLAAAAAVVFAQTAPEAQQPPAGVDEALRARVTEFYQYHVTEEYRKAEKLVAEESQDIYYVASKRKYLNFEIKSIQYFDNFTRAKVMTICEQYFHGIGFEGKPLKAPSTSTWKVVDGKWFWYVDKEELAKGPFGPMANAGTKAAPGVQLPGTDKIPTNFDFALGQVKWEKDSVVVKPNATQQVAILSKSMGSVSLVIARVLPGIEVTIDKANLNNGEKATVTFKSGENPHSGSIAFRLVPTGEIISIDVKRQ